MSKYHAQPTTLDGIRFASKAEARRYAELKLLQRAKQIRALRWHTRWPLFARSRRAVDSHIGDYVDDFDYVVVATNVLVIEDVKGVTTALYRWKKKHFEAQYGRPITEVRRR